MPPQNEITPHWITFLDYQQDVKPFIQAPPQDTSRDKLIELVTEGVCDWVQQELGRPIAPTRFFKRFSGGSGFNMSHISLPYYPVIDANMVVTETWGTSGQHTLTEQTPTAQGGADTYSLDPLTGIITRSFNGLIARPFFPGLRNVEVTWTAGYNPIPASIRLGCLEAIQWWWDNTQEAPRRIRPAGGGYESPGAGSPEFFGTILPAMMAPILSNFMSVGIG